MMDRETARDLLPAYALGALDETERRDLEALLADWPEARRDLAEFMQAADLLAYVPEDQRPPIGLEGKIITQARAQRAPGRRPRPARRPVGVRRLTRFAPHAFAAAFAALAVLFGLMAFNKSTPIDTEGHWFPITGTEQARAYVALNDAGAPSALIFRYLPPLPEGKVYQLFLLPETGDQPIAGPTFTLQNTKGWAAVVFPSPPPQSLQGFGITVEPEGGSTTPSGPAFTFPAYQ